MADLQSKQYAQIVDLLCEGPIEGLVNGLQSVYLEETPVQRADGQLNYTGVTLQTRTGTNNQTYMEGFPSVENEIGVSAEFTQSIQLVRTVSGTDVNAVRVKLLFAPLYKQNTSTGALEATSVQIAIDVAQSGGSFAERVLDTVTGKTTNRYAKDYLINLAGTTGPWQVRIRRLTPDSTSGTLVNKTYWDSYTEIIYSKMRYPNSALVGLRFDSASFGQIPRRAYDVKLLKVKVPSNYNPVTRTYLGVWDGTFTTAWTQNPAWVLYDLLTNSRYGLGEFIPSTQVDKWALYSIAQYCDQLVPNGKGGQEPRFTCNCYIQNAAEAYRVVQDLASVFRGMVFWASGGITAAQDRPGDAVYLYTAANVIDGQFTYSGSSVKARHTVALVSWNDPRDFYRQKVEYVEDVDAISRYGLITTDVTAFGCTSQGQAQRVGRWLLYSEQYEDEVVTFQTGLEGAVARPGQLIKISDPTRAGVRLGGRVVDATQLRMTIDAFEGSQAGSWTVSYLKTDGTVETRSVSSLDGNNVFVSAPFSEAPAVGTIWMLAKNDVQPQMFRVLSVMEEQDGKFSISALAHNPSKYDAIENGTAIQETDITALTLQPVGPTNIVVTESTYIQSATRRININVAWDHSKTAASYLVAYRYQGGSAVYLPETTSNYVDIPDAVAGSYQFFVYSKNALGVVSQPSSITKQVTTVALTPANMTGFSLVPNAGIAFLSWNQSTDTNVLVGGTVRIRHSGSLNGATWANSIDLLPALSGNTSTVQAPLLTGTYLARFYDAQGIPSAGVATISTQVPETLAVNVVTTSVQHPTFSGTKTNCQVVGGELRITDKSLPGEYQFSNTIDLSQVYTSRVTALIVAAGIDENDLIDARTSLVDEWVDVDGASIETVNAELYFRTTENDPTSPAAVWTEWKPFFVSDYRARAFQFKMMLKSTFPTHNISVSQLSATVDMPDRVEGERSIISGADAKNVTFPNSFYATPTIGITAYDMATGDYYEVTNQSATGFTVTFKSAGGTPVSRTFDYIAKGYGRNV